VKKKSEIQVNGKLLLHLFATEAIQIGINNKNFVCKSLRAKKIAPPPNVAQKAEKLRQIAFAPERA
jgi:hypothetical protein